jgi:hypothetical protein
VTLPNLDRQGQTTKPVYGQILDEISLGGGFLHPLQVIDQQDYQQLMPESDASAGKHAGRPVFPARDRRPTNKRKQP